MSNNRFGKWLLLAPVLAGTCLVGTFLVSTWSGLIQAAETDDVLKAGVKRVAASQNSQQRIEQISDQTTELLSEYKSTNRQLEGLRVYNAQLQAQIDNQVQRMSELQHSIDSATVMERQITPLTLNMIESLDQFVALDIPFLLEERQQRVQRLRDNAARADLSVAEKFRQILEAYEIESEYGAKVETYKALLPVGGAEREMNVLRVGRIALMAQSTNQDVSLGWSKSSGQWVELGSEYRGAIAKGIRIAKKQAAIDMLELPISAPEVSVLENSVPEIVQ